MRNCLIRWWRGSYHLLLLGLLLVSFLMMGCGRKEDSHSQGQHELVRLDVSASPITTSGAANLQIAKGDNQPFVATAHYSNGTFADVTDSVVWSSSTEDVGIIDAGGVMSGLGIGVTQISANKGGVSSNAVEIEVTDAVLRSIQVSPGALRLAKGQVEELEATAVYSDQTTSDISDEVTWLTADANTVSISQAGKVLGISPGITQVTAHKDGVSSVPVEVEVTNAYITAIQVNPTSLRLAKGQREKLQAMAIYSDETTSDVSDDVSWSVSDPMRVSVSASGLVMGKLAGSTEVKANLAGVSSNPVKVEVTEAVLAAIQISPLSLRLAQGQVAKLEATAVYSDQTMSDISNDVIWIAEDPATVSVTGAGEVFGVAVGITQVQAIKEGITSKPVRVEVTDAFITEIQISPSSVRIAKDQIAVLRATAIYSDQSRVDISDNAVWVVTDPTFASISSSGELMGLAVGKTELTVSKDGVSSKPVEVEVTDAVITAIEVSPVSLRLAKGQIEELRATAIYSDNSRVDISDFAAWYTEETATANVTRTGRVVGIDVGTTRITASKDGVSSIPVDIEVTDAVITNIRVEPDSISLYIGEMAELKAIATYSDQSESDITDFADWMPQAYGNPYPDDTWVNVTRNGRVIGITATVFPGEAQVTASKDGITSEPVEVEVLPAYITKIEMILQNKSLPAGSTAALFIRYHLSDGRISESTDCDFCTSSDDNIAIIKRISDQYSILTRMPGKVTISIPYSTPDGQFTESIDIEVTDPVLESVTVLTHPRGHLDIIDTLDSLKEYMDSSLYKMEYRTHWSDSIWGFAHEHEISWSTSDSSIATISPEGVLKGLSVGSVDVIATVTAGLRTVTASKKFDVTCPVVRHGGLEYSCPYYAFYNYNPPNGVPYVYIGPQERYNNDNVRCDVPFKGRVASASELLGLLTTRGLPDHWVSTNLEYFSGQIVQSNPLRTSLLLTDRSDQMVDMISFSTITPAIPTLGLLVCVRPDQ